MAHNVTIGDNTFASNQSSNNSVSAQHQIVQPAYGALGSAQIVTSSYPMPTCTYPVDGSGVALTPQFAAINLTATGTLVNAVTSKKIRVLLLSVTFECQTGDETYIFKSGASGTALTGAFCDAAAAGAVIPVNPGYCPVGHFETAAGSLLELALAGTSPNAQGYLVYVTLS